MDEHAEGDAVPEIVEVPVSDLLLDTGNPRLGVEQQSQQAVYLSLAKQQGRRLVVLARHIVEHGLDPLTLPAVVATGDRRRRYLVVEGNRRVLALKALETPTIIAGALSPADSRAFAALAEKFSEDPIEVVSCVLFDGEDEAYQWVMLRHTGTNEGAGLHEWDANEIDRARARHGGSGRRNLGGQVIDLVDRLDGPSTSKTKILSNVERLAKSRGVRDLIGLDKEGQELVSLYPAEELLKPLRRILDDLRSQTIKVNDIYYAPQQEAYVKGFAPDDLPDPSKRLKQPVALSDLQLTRRGGRRGTKAAPPPPPKRPRTPPPRTALIPATCQINPTTPRVNEIYNELVTLNADQYPNAAAVLLRVFAELSIDHYMADNNILTERQRGAKKLADKLKLVAQHLKDAGKIDEQHRRAIDRIANSQTVIAASTFSFNQYVHNRYVRPKPSELFTSWDELQLFFERVWA